MNIASQMEVFDWRPATWLKIGGADAASFLQGQFTNDLRSVSSNAPVYGLWLNLKGKVLADSFVFPSKTSGEFWVGSLSSPASTIRERLEAFVIADDVVIEDETDRWSGLTLFGGDACELPASITDQSFLFTGRRTHSAHRELVFPTATVQDVHAFFSAARRIDRAEMERRRIEAAIPLVPVDIGPTDLPNEGGLDAEAISYTKGCYLGQEVMARLKSMGQVRRRLLRVTGPTSAIPSLPAPLFLGGRQVGELRSAVLAADGLIGLAMLTLMHLQPQSVLAFAIDAEPKLRVVTSP